MLNAGGKYDFYRHMERADYDTAAAAKLTACLRYAVSYGMRKRESYLTTFIREYALSRLNPFKMHCARI